ncbi:hypothetical protein LCGC14_0232700 [marine sediment metagenome]|uniref:Uncharacterized protein n=1 Tax=marine sediment metagenome TaxID=412755 RepID=A0A0F9UEQ6_9ZZZZ
MTRVFTQATNVRQTTVQAIKERRTQPEVHPNGWTSRCVNASQLEEKPMPRVHHVKKARKDNPVVKRGEPYYWWKFAFGPKRFSKTHPRRSQLTQSDFLGQVYDLEDEIGDLKADSALNDFTDDFAERIRALGEEQADKRANMPEQLQDAPTGEMLEGRQCSCDEWADNFENLDFEFDEDAAKEEVNSDFDDDEHKPSKAEFEAAIEEKRQEFLDALLEEMQGFRYEGE